LDAFLMTSEINSFMSNTKIRMFLFSRHLNLEMDPYQMHRMVQIPR